MTLNLDDLIKYENESTRIDFKSTPYKKEKFDDFIKDIMSMANADIETDRYIIVGVKTHPNCEKEFLGIQKIDFLDSATYQQIISSNVEPAINLEYFSHQIDETFYGIFKISNCSNQPYLMKKDFRPSLKKGDGYIRIGSHQRKLERQDYDRIFSKRMSEKSFDGDIDIKFSDNKNTTINLSPLKNFVFPSFQIAEKIKKILEERKQKPFVDAGFFFSATSDLFRSKPYEERTTEELEKNLANVHKTYADDDDYELFELNSHKINLLIENKGQQYIEDATIEVEFPKIDGLLIADQIYSEPYHQSSPFEIAPIRSNLNKIYYPSVKDKKESFVVSQTIGNIKHHLPVTAFQEPIRLIFGPKTSGVTIEIKCKIYAKNLAKPVMTILKIIIDD